MLNELKTLTETTGNLNSHLSLFFFSPLPLLHTHSGLVGPQSQLLQDEGSKKFTSIALQSPDTQGRNDQVKMSHFTL